MCHKRYGLALFGILVSATLAGNALAETAGDEAASAPAAAPAVPLAATPATPAATPAAQPQTVPQTAKKKSLELMLYEEDTVVVASQKAEPLSEAPVITSIITADEIRRMGARTLEDVLVTIPGYSHIQDQNEYYGAERGIYASSQQKILVLRDGHRLNSRSYSEANFDYSLSLDNIKRIEVLRGSGASLYGDVALTGVINIVTKDGKDINGAEIKGGVGNFQQRHTALVTGGDLGTLGDVMFSGAIYANQGQTASWPDPRNPSAQGSSFIYGFRDKPAYDTYLKYHLGDFGLSASRRYGHYIEPRSGSGVTGQIYDIDKTAWFSGETPGLSSAFDHYEVSYAPKLGDLGWTTKVYYDGFQLRANLVLDALTGSQGDLHWNEWTGGFQSYLSVPYSLLGEGSALVGVQGEEMEVYDSGFASGVPPNLAPSAVPVLETGKEKIYAVFGQLKHKFFQGLIASLGLRYDYKERRPDMNGMNVPSVVQLSPRAALIYSPLEALNFRLNYSHAFADAPYWYRYNTLPSYQGAMTLMPERLHSFQFTIENSILAQLSHRLNVFYDDFMDVVFRDLSGVYTNAGKVISSGLEYEISYKQDDLATRANYTYQRTNEATGYATNNGRLENIPAHMANWIVDYAPLRSLANLTWGKDLWLNVGLRYIGPQYARWGKALPSPADTVDQVLLVNAGVQGDKLVDKFSLGFHVYNLFDQQYYQGGSVEYPYLQAGRWYMAEASYQF